MPPRIGQVLRVFRRRPNHRPTAPYCVCMTNNLLNIVNGKKKNGYHLNMCIVTNRDFKADVNVMFMYVYQRALTLTRRERDDNVYVRTFCADKEMKKIIKKNKMEYRMRDEQTLLLHTKYYNRVV